MDTTETIPGTYQEAIDTLVEWQSKLPARELGEFCRRNHIARLAVFGSLLRNDFNDASDVDLLVEFERGRVPGLKFFGLQEELSEMLGCRVDLNTPNSLSPYFRKSVEARAVTLYDAGRYSPLAAHA